MAREIVGPFAFGLSAFTLIFASVDILAVSKLVTEEHAPLGAALLYFLLQLPYVVTTTLPMAMLLGTLLTVQRLSGESELTAMKAGGIGLVRAAAPLLAAGAVVSLLALGLQEGIVPYANDRAVDLRTETIKHIGAYGAGSHTVTTPLPGGGQQVTYFRGYDAAAAELLAVTIVTYGADTRPQLILFSERGRYAPPTWSFENATEYRFNADGSTTSFREPRVQVDVGERPSELQERTADNNRETMSRSQIRDLIGSGQLSPQETRSYQMTYEEKLARPFASFVFTLIAVPFGLRSARGGKGTGAGFGLALAIVFVWFILTSAMSAVFAQVPGGYAVSAFGAWLPNLLFTAIGAVAISRAARR